MNRPILIYQDPNKGEVILEFDTELEAEEFSRQPELNAEILDNNRKQIRIKYYAEAYYV